jgi:hypothetical protein
MACGAHKHYLNMADIVINNLDKCYEVFCLVQHETTPNYNHKASFFTAMLIL